MPITPAHLRNLAVTLANDGVFSRSDVNQLIDATLEDGALSGEEKAELESILTSFSDRIDSGATRTRLQAFVDSQDDGIRALARALEKDDGVIDAAEAQKILDLVGEDGKVSNEERFSLAALLLGAALSADARARLQSVSGGLIEVKAAPRLPIPDNDARGVTSSLTVAASGEVESLEIDVQLKHTWKGDLTVKLVGPDGTSVLLHDRAGRSTDDLRGTFPTTLAPAGSLDALKGKSVSGEWKLVVSDSAGQDVGELESWALRVKTTATGGATGNAKPLDPAGNHRPVFLSAEGWFVESAGGSVPANDVDLGDGLFRMAQLVDDMSENPLARAALSLAERRTVHDNLEAALAKVPASGPVPAGLDDVQAKQLRSSAATVLLSLLEATGNSGAERELKEELFGSYVRTLKAETNPVLRDSMIWQVARIADTLPPGIRATAKDLVQEIAPLSPPYDEWFANGNDTLNIAWKTGPDPEFYPGTVELLKARGFTAEGAERSRGPAIYQKTMTNDDGVETKVRVHLSISRDNVFDEMADPSFHIVGYDGHSDIGRNIPQSLRRSPAPDGKKLIFYGLCAGKDALSLVRERYPDAQLLTTFNSSYFNTADRNGAKVMTRSENFNVLMELVEGASERRGWDSINDDIRDDAVLFPYHHPMAGGTNYISPIHTAIRRKVLDTDHDGQADYLDKLVNFDTFKVTTDTAREFTAIAPTHPAEKLDGTVPHLAAQALNTATGYNTTTQAYKKQNVLADGYFAPAAGETRIVKFERDEVDGQRVMRMQVNANYAHMSVEGLRAAAQYQFVQDMDSSLSVVDKKLMGLVFAAFSIIYDEQYYSRDTQIWSGLLKAYNLPSDLPFHPLKSLLDAEHHDYSGNLQHIRAWKESIPAASLALLERDDVGVTG